MAWRRRIVILFSGLGAGIYSALGLFVYNYPRLKEWIISPLFLVPIILIGVTLWGCRQIKPHPSDSPQLKFRDLNWGFLALGAGVILAAILWGIFSSLYLDHVWDLAKKRGYVIEVPHAVPIDSSEDNAVVWLNRARSEINSHEKDKETDLTGDFIREAASGKIDSKNQIQIQKALRTYSKALTFLDRAFQCPRINWQPYGYCINDRPPKMAYQLHLSRLACCREILNAKAGRYEQAAREIEENLWLAHSILPIHLVISDMLGIAEYKIVLNSSQYRFQHIPLKKIESTWNSYLKPVDLTHEMKAGLSIEFFLHWERMGENEPNIFGERIYNPLEYFFFKPFAQFDSASAIRGNIRFMDCFNMPYPLIKPAYEKAKAEYKKEGWILAQIGLPRWNEYYDKALVDEAQLKTAVMALEARRYYVKFGHWPENIGELERNGLSKEDATDPFNGQELKIKRNGGDLLIYSIGPDLVDDGGLKVFDKSTNKGDIVFQINLKS